MPLFSKGGWRDIFGNEGDMKATDTNKNFLRKEDLENLGNGNAIK